MVDTMKDMINYYYNLDVTRIIPIHDDNVHESMKTYKYCIEADNSKFILKEINYDSNQLNYSVINQLRKIEYFLKPVFNINNDVITRIDNRECILLKCSNIPWENISLFDIKIDYYISGYSFNIDSWIKMWENKIDNFENWLYNKKNEYLEYFPLFQYFIGISENALLYLKEIKEDNFYTYTSNCVAAHRRIGMDTTLYEYYDSTTIITDHPSRDIAEYIKSMIINRCFDSTAFREYLEKLSFSKDDMSILYARILFPTFFYDYIEGKKDLTDLITSMDYYENCISEIGKVLNNGWNVKMIEWLRNKKNHS